jgi:homoserine dehydrogenase
MQAKLVRIGLLGCGNVGAPLVHMLREEGAAIAARTGLELAVTRIAVRSAHRDRDLPDLPDGTLTTDARAVAADPEVDLVVELIGGIEPARELVLSALANAKPVVTGNKELLANHGAELFAAAEAAGRDLLFEAAVGGGIPVVRAVRESLLGEPVGRIMGIVNGTTNYILSQMTDGGASYADALADAQGKGYAERDPTADVEGFDAGAKIAILASIAFGARIVAGDVYHEGISAITAADIAFARSLGYVIKLLAITERIDAAGPNPTVAVRVHPAMVPVTHPLAAVRDSFNAVFIEGSSVGELMLYGRGAGGRPTASAVLGDILDAAGNLVRGAATPLGSFGPAAICPIDELRSAYYLNLEVSDRPGVLAQVAGAFAERGVSIRSMEQEGLGDEARLVFITHEAREADVQATLHTLRQLDSVRHIRSLLRVIG